MVGARLTAPSRRVEFVQVFSEEAFVSQNGYLFPDVTIRPAFTRGESFAHNALLSVEIVFHKSDDPAHPMVHDLGTGGFIVAMGSGTIKRTAPGLLGFSGLLMSHGFGPVPEILEGKA